MSHSSRREYRGLQMERNGCGGARMEQREERRRRAQEQIDMRGGSDDEAVPL